MREALTVNTTSCDAGLTDLRHRRHLLIGGDPILSASTKLGEDSLPVLLNLTRKPGQERFAGQFGPNALLLQGHRVLDSRSVVMSSGGMDSSTLGTPPAFHPQP